MDVATRQSLVACLHDYNQRAIQQLHQLQPVGFVADYKADCNALIAQIFLPTEARMFFWNHGLNSGIMAACTLDPASHIAFRNVSNAQKAALAADYAFQRSRNASLQRKQV